MSFWGTLASMDFMFTRKLPFIMDCDIPIKQPWLQIAYLHVQYLKMPQYSVQVFMSSLYRFYTVSCIDLVKSNLLLPNQLSVQRQYITHFHVLPKYVTKSR